GASDAKLAGGGIGEKLDILDALAELVEHGDAAPDDGVAVLRRLDAPRAALEQAHAERMLEVGGRPRDGRLRRAEALRRLGHAAGLDHGHQHAHVVQLEAALDAIDLGHGGIPISDLIWLYRTIAFPGDPASRYFRSRS